MDQTVVVRKQEDESSKDGVSNLDQVFLADMGKAVNALQQAGFKPLDQLIGYVLTGNPLYITSRGNARAIVAGMDREFIREYLTRNGKWTEVYA